MNRIEQAASATAVLTQDRAYTRYTPGLVKSDARLMLSPLRGLEPNTSPTFASSDAAVATVDQQGNVQHIGDGSAIITASWGGCTRGQRLNFATATSGATGDVFTGFAAGTLGAAASAAIDSRIAGRTAALAKPVYTTQNHTAGTYVRNAACWAADIDLTCASPWNSSGGAHMAGTLVSPRHIVFATHYQIGVGATVRFVTMAGAVVERVMTAKLPLAVTGNYYPDLTVGVLDSDVPASITFARVLPDTWPTKLSQRGKGVPVLELDQEEKALVSDAYFLGSDDAAAQQWAYMTQPSDATRAAFSEENIGGDSGNPIFMIVAGVPVLLTVMTFRSYGYGTFLGGFKTAINAAIATLGGGYQLTEIDLSAYPALA